jgi:hypothetical protein
MATIVTRTGKGSALTWAEGDANFSNLNADKLENITLRGDSGSDAAITSNEIVRISGGTGLTSVVTAESTGQSTVTINLDDTAVTPNTYTLATITVDQQGRITSASSGTGGGGFSSFTLAGDSGTSQTVNDGNTVTISGGTGLSTVASATDTVTINLDNTAVTPNTYTYATITVDQQGRLTSASSGTSPVTSVSGTGTVNGISLSGTVTSTGSLTLGGTLDLSSPPAIGGTTAAAVSATSLTFKDPREAIYDLGTTGGTIAPNVSNGSVQKITLNSALTMNAFTSPVAGQSMTLIIYGGTAYTSITSTMKFAGGVKTLTGTASCIDILSVYYDGTTYFASLNKGFA